MAKVAPVGAPRAVRPVYALVDAYLAFWFRVCYADLALIDGGQGAAVLRRARPRWETHLGQVFEELARAHARRLVERGDLPADLVVGRWWAATGEPCEVDVLGLQGARTALLGEARWQAAPLGLRELEALRRKAARVPSPVDTPLYALWGRTESRTRCDGLGRGGSRSPICWGNRVVTAPPAYIGAQCPDECRGKW